MKEYIVYWLVSIDGNYDERRTSFKTNKGASVLLNLLMRSGIDSSVCGIDLMVDGRLVDFYDPDDGSWNYGT